MKPVKPPTKTDLALRSFILDLIKRNQVPVMKDFAPELGHNHSQALTHFLKGGRNYPKTKIKQSIDILTKKYGARREFLETNSGTMYAGKPYSAVHSVSSVQEAEEYLGTRNLKNLQQLAQKNIELEDQLKELRKLVKAQEETIDTQKKYINRLEK